VLHEHCAHYDRDPAEIRVTHLGAASLLADLPAGGPPAGDPVARPHEHAGSLDEQIGRYRLLAEAGIQTAIVDVPDLTGTSTPAAGLAPWAEVIRRFR
jgi:hypothetical protein